MVNIKKYEIGILLLLVVYFQFAATNINPTLGTIYSIFALASAVFLILDPKRDVQFRKDGDSLLGSIAVGAFAYLGLLLVGGLIIIPGINKIIALLSATTPVLATSVFFNNITFGVAVPITETFFFFIVVYDVLASWMNVEISWNNITNPRLIALIGVISFAFMIFHLTSKGVENIAILGLVFVMGLISLLLVTYFKTGEKATWFHIVSNSASLFI
jgi:hypothetical protein